MTDVAMSQNEEAPKKGRKGLIIGVLGAVILGGAAFFVTYTGIFPSAGGDSEVATDSHGAPVDDGRGTPVEGEHGIELWALAILILFPRPRRFHDTVAVHFVVAVVRYTPERLARVGDRIACLARAESMEAHARAVGKRLKGGNLNG